MELISKILKFGKLFSYLIACFIVISCDNSNDPIDPNNHNIDSTVKVTFIELGSVNCVPCQKMRPIMDSVEKKYGSQVFVKFIDCIKNYKESVPYKINVMPTQVFLDSLGVEFHRHEGFYSEDSIHILLQAKGLKIIN